MIAKWIAVALVVACFVAEMVRGEGYGTFSGERMNDL